MRLHIVPHSMWKYVVMTMARQAIERNSTSPQQRLARALKFTVAQAFVLVYRIK